MKAAVHWKGSSSASHPRGPRSRYLALAFSYEAVASVREELVQEIALAIWQALRDPGPSPATDCIVASRLCS